MLRRLFVLGSVLGFGLLLCIGTVRAQCSGYSITSTDVNLLSPAQAAAQGYMTATITINANAAGAIPSHFLEVTYDTGGGWSWNSSAPSGSTAAMYYTINGGTTQYNYHSVPLTGSDPNGWQMSSGNAGNYYTWWFVVTAPNGSSTRDRVKLTVDGVSGASIVSHKVPINAYYQLSTKFSGPSMLNSCSECQMQPNKCINQHHTPLFDANLSNPQSGDTQIISNGSAGNIANENESVSGSSSIMISVLPGDTPSGSTTDKVYCSMFGWIMSQQWTWGFPDLEFAVTAVEIIPSSCNLVLRFFENNDSWGIQCNVAWKKPPATADRCSAISQPPDFQPASIWDEQTCKTPGNCNASDMPPPNGTNANYPKYWYTASAGVRYPPGAPNPDPPVVNGGAHGWFFPGYVLEGFVPGGPDEAWWILDLENLAIPKGTGLPVDCTYRDHGTSPIGVPW